MGTCTATFTKDTYNLGEDIVCNFSWTGGFFCDASGYYARVAILDNYGNEVVAANRQTSSGTNFPLTYLPTQTGTTWTGKITLYQYPNCNPPLCIDTDTCTIISPTVTLTLASTPTAGGTTHAHPACCTYNSGDYIAVHAVSNSGYEFDYWTDNHGNTVYSSEWNFYITSDTTCTAHFSIATTYTLSLNNAPYTGGFIWNDYNNNYCTVTQCNITNIPAGTSLTISAFTEPGWAFDGWTGNIGSCNPLSLDCEIIMNQNRSITANFSQPTYTLTRAASGNGDLPACSPPCCTYNPGATVTLTANAWSGWHFDHWTGTNNNSDNPTTVTMNSNKSVTAYYLVDQPTTGACCTGDTCAITTPAACTETFLGLGTTCTPNPCVGVPTGSAEITLCPTSINETITAYFTWNNAIQPSMDDIAYMYIKKPDDTIAASWVEDTYGNPTGTKELSIPIDQTGTWTAHIDIANGAGTWISYEDTCIIETGYLLTTTVTPTGAGTITLEPPGGQYYSGQQVTITAVPTPSTDYVFDYWTGDLTGKNNPQYLTIDENKTVTAHFKLTTEVTCYGCYYGEVTSDGYPIGTICNTTNTPNHPSPTYSDCKTTDWRNYFIYAGAGLAIAGAVIYLVRRKTITRMGQQTPPPAPKTRKKTKK